MSVGADDWERSHLIVEHFGYGACTGLGWKQAVFVDQHGVSGTLSLEGILAQCFMV